MAQAKEPGTAPSETRDVIAARYRLVRRIGEGGMGVVYAGEHLELQSPVAIKVLQPSLATDRGARARFLREARLAASIQGDHVVRIHDVGTDEDDRPYMAMELLSGESVDARLAREGKLPLELTATIVLQMLEALGEAHAKGLVHRDLKPANLFLVDRPGEACWVKVLDFGISKAWGAEPTSTFDITAPQTILGSPEYMSPEQLRDAAQVESRSDLWACGVVLFELLSGSMPFEGSSLAELCANVIGSPPRTLASAGVQVPADVAEVVSRCLAKDPVARPRSAYEIAVVLAPYASSAAAALLPRIRAWSAASSATIPGAVLSTQSAPRAKARGIGRGLGGVAVVMALGALALGLVRRASSVAPSAPAAAGLVMPATTAAAKAPSAAAESTSPPIAQVPSASLAAPPPPVVSAAKQSGSAPGAGVAPASKPRPAARKQLDLDAIELVR